MRNAVQTIPVRKGEEFDERGVLEFLRREIPDLPAGEMRVQQFPTGASNLTYLIEINGWKAVLRRPPLGPVPPRAHDMVREAQLLSRLSPVFPLAPRPYAVCSDESLIGAPFSVMEYRRGLVIDREFPPGLQPSVELCRGLADRLTDTLVELHAVDYRAAGMSDVGRPEGFLERQTHGWIGRYEKARTDEIPEVGPLAAWLAENLPTSPPATIIHNDFKLNNLLFDVEDPGRVVAVLDWEMATVGDPLFDLAVFLSYWAEPDDPPPLQRMLPVLDDLTGFPTRRELMARYARASGRDISHIDWYLTFAYFKLAVIQQQIYARYVRGQTQDPRFASFGESVRYLIVHAHGLTQPVGGL
jgi:aminoglycoside phosphotransferase (APT) family kinase protein